MYKVKFYGADEPDRKNPFTNQDDSITNTDTQQDIDEGMEEATKNSIGGKNEPEIDRPTNEPEKTEKKIPNMERTKNDSL
jgi:hypothetical protein